MSRTPGNDSSITPYLDGGAGVSEACVLSQSKESEVPSPFAFTIRYLEAHDPVAQHGVGILLLVVVLALLSCSLFLLLDVTGGPMPESSPAERPEGRQSVISFRRGQAPFKVAHDPSLDPSGAADRIWAVLVSTRFKKLPSIDSRNVVAVKYDKLQKPYLGWALALANHGGVCCFPEVYWSSERGSAWHRFPRIDVGLDQWWLLGFSFERGRYLVGWGQQIEHRPGSSAVATSATSFRGAYDVGLGAVAASHGDFYLGAPSDNSFRGSIDFAGIFEGSLDGAEVWFEATANDLFGEGVFDLPADRNYTSLERIMVLPDEVRRMRPQRERSSKRGVKPRAN